MEQAPESRRSVRSSYKKHGTKEYLVKDNIRLLTPRHRRLINSIESFPADDDNRFRMLSMQRMDQILAIPLRQQLSINPSLSYSLDKPSFAHGFPFASSTKQGGKFESFSSNLVRQKNTRKEAHNYKEDKKLDASIRQWNRKVDTTLGVVEKKEDVVEEEQSEEQFQYDDATDVSPLTMHGTISHMMLFRKTFGNIQAPKYDREKEIQLAQMVKKQLKKGYTVAQMATDPAFEKVLDICCDKTYFTSSDETNAEISLGEWRALRKCKYLRVSEKSITSLKEATLEALKDE